LSNQIATLVRIYPAVKVQDVDKYPAIGSDRRELGACDHVLNGFFRAADVDRRLFYAEQPRLHWGALLRALGDLRCHPIGESVD
jgi:hypothetical protein